MPFRLLYVISDVIYYPVYYVLRYRRKIVRKNLKESFPNKSVAEIIIIEKGFYHFFIDVILESCKMLSISNEEMKLRMKFVNIDLINKTLEKGKSVSAFIGHYGNWEWLSSSGLWIAKGAKVIQIYHQIHNKSVDRIMIIIRECLGNNICVEMHKTARFILHAMNNKKPYLIGFIADQSPTKKESAHFLNFLNHEVPVLIGTEKLTKHFGLDAVFVSIKRIKRGYYECTFSPLTGNTSTNTDFNLTHLYYKKLELEIRQQPEYYLWTHNRFKHAHKVNNHLDYK